MFVPSKASHFQRSFNLMFLETMLLRWQIIFIFRTIIPTIFRTIIPTIDRTIIRDIDLVPRISAKLDAHRRGGGIEGVKGTPIQIFEEVVNKSEMEDTMVHPRQYDPPPTDFGYKFELPPPWILTVCIYARAATVITTVSEVFPMPLPKPQFGI